MSKENPSGRADPFLEEVRRLKRDAFRRSGDDWEKHRERLRRLEEKHRERVVLPPKDPKAGAA